MVERAIMGFDYGTKSIGVAIGQEVTCTASMLLAVNAKNGIPDWQQITNLIDEWQPNVLIVGYPLNMDNSTQNVTNQAVQFACQLEKRFQLSVKLHDERLTTAAAKEQIFQQKGYRGLQKATIDSMAAKIIVESWMTELGTTC